MIRNLVLGFFAVLAVLGIFFSGLGSFISARQEAEEREAREAAAKHASAVAVQRCIAARSPMLAEHRALSDAGKHTEAARVFGDCGQVLQDSQLVALVTQSATAALVAMVTDTSDTAAGRLAALAELRKVDAGAAASFEQLAARLTTTAARDAEVAAKKAERERLAKAKKEGVRLGMTKQQVLESSWGRPERINRTTNALGSREQWVYGGVNFLYFEGDRLTAIQN